MSPEQVEDLIYIENNKGAYVSLISRGDEKLAEELLERQEEQITQSATSVLINKVIADQQ